MIKKLQFIVTRINFVSVKLAILCVVSFLCFSLDGYSQGATCAAATNVAVNTLYTGGQISDTTINDPTAPVCNGQTPLRDAWISFVATSSTAKVIVEAAGRNLLLYAYSGVCGTLTQIGCANATITAGRQTEIMNLSGLTSSNRYYIRFANSSNFTLNLDNFIIVTNNNNDCTNATPVPVNSDENCTSYVTSTTVGTTQSIAAISCGYTGNADDDVWFSFVANNTSHIITGYPYAANEGGINDMVIDVRSGTCNGTNIFCADSTSGANTETVTATGLIIGSIYYFRIYSYGNALNVGAFDVCITTPTYCEPSTDSPEECYIDDVKFVGTLNDVSTLNSSYGSNNGYQDWTGRPKAIQAQGEAINIIADGGYRRGGWKAWVDWNKDRDFNDPGEEIFNPAGSIGLNAVFGFVIPVNQPIGDYVMRIRIGINFWDFNGNGTFQPNEELYYDFDSCEDFINTTYFGDSDYYYGEAEDYAFTVISKCETYIATTTNGERCDTGSVNLSFTGTGAAGVTGFNVYTAKTGGTLLTPTPIPAIANAATWATPNISTTTTYWLTATNGTCQSTVRVPIRATVQIPPPALTFTPSAPILCGEGTIVEVTANAGTLDAYLIDEKFETNLGNFQNENNDTNIASVKAITQWQKGNSTLIPAGGNVWKPAISSGINNNGFAIATSDHNLTPKRTVDNSLTLTNSVNSTNFTSLTLSLDMFYLRYLGDNITDPTYVEYVNIDVSINGGTNWIPVETILTDYGYGSNFLNKTVNLNAYINQGNLKIRIRHVSFAETVGLNSGWLPDGIAVDNVQLFGKKTVTDFNWTVPGVDVYIDAAATVPYTAASPVETVYIKPSATQLENNPFTITVTSITSAICPASGSISLVNNTKYFKGTNNDWDNAASWKPIGLPGPDNCIVISKNVKIPNDNIPLPPVGYQAYAKNLTIKSTGSLEILSGNNLTVTDWIHNEGTNNFNIRNDASLLQVNNDVNIGAMKMDRTLMVKKTDYTYYSSPVDGFNLTILSPGTPTGVKFKWEPTTNPGGGFEYGNWISPESEIMALGKGYIVRGPSAFATEQSLTAVFDGTPRNGTIPVPISRGNYQGAGIIYDAGRPVTKDDDNFNLIGNPYPSAIRASSFLSNAQNNNILGTIWLWPHGGMVDETNPDPFYQDYVYNYNSADYITANGMGSVPPGTFNGFIAAGQAFFVLMEDSGSSSENIFFNNLMRVTNNNTQFFRPTDAHESNEVDVEIPEPQCIYLDLVLPDGKTNSILVGYTEGATYDADRLFDSPLLDNTTQLLYSKIGEANMIIQGRPMPLDDNDQVTLGVLIPQQGIYTIAINSVNGIFLDATQDIYLEDYVTGMIHNLKNAPYIFSADTGRYDDRFVLRYNNEDGTLTTPEFTANNDVKIVGLKEYIKVTSKNMAIKNIDIYDVSGKLIISYKDVKTLEFKIPLDKISQGTLIVKATLDNGQQKTAKVIH